MRLGRPGLLVAGAAVAPAAADVMSSTRIFADDTRLPVLDPGQGRTKTGCLWGYAIDDRPWGGHTPPAVRSISMPRIARASTRQPARPSSRASCRSMATQVSRACWRAARRTRSSSRSVGRIAGGASTSSTGPRARRWRKKALRRIGELYRLEAEIRGRPAEERRTVRQERSKPIIEALRTWL